MRKILFLTGTRADFGKLKSLMTITQNDPLFEVHIFATGMHLHNKYGYTVNEIEKSGFKNIYKYINFTSEESMDLTLSKTIEGLSSYIKEERPDLIVVHGDRPEALAGAIVGAFNNILVAHVEGGEVSGTIDELIRHAVSKLSHTHFVANELAKNRLVQMGEIRENVFIIGSPDLDIMFSPLLPGITSVKDYYEIKFEKYGIVMFHSVTTELNKMKECIHTFVDALLEDKLNYVVIYPNNDMGSQYIIDEYDRLKNNSRFRIFPSLRFEYFLVLLKNCSFILGNSSAGIREAPYYGIPCINIGTRQKNRSNNSNIINCDCTITDILNSIQLAKADNRYQTHRSFGNGNSNKRFLEILKTNSFWTINKQKQFVDMIS
jgi:UDP-N-acetylglucosamine 2-epimerase (hydrolysing)